MIEDAKVALLLVSENFLASDFITKNELPPLLEAAQHKGVLVLWLALSAIGGKETPIAGFQGLNDPGKPLSEMSEDEQKKILRLAYKKIKKSLEAVH